MKARWGILGGTFDPIHYGHLRAAEEVYEALSLEKVLFIPAGQPPHKYRPDLSPFDLRLELVQAALKGVPHFQASDIEGNRPGPSYSVVTLEILTQEFPHVDFFFILGLDAFADLGSWFRFQDLPHLAHLVIISRGPGDVGLFQKILRRIFPEATPEASFWRLPGGKTIRFLPVTRLDISATRIRSLIRQGQSPRFLLPDAVWEVIKKQGLYQGPSDKISG